MTPTAFITLNATVAINALQNLQSALSRAVLYVAHPSVRLSPSVRPSVTRVDNQKRLVKIMQFSPYSILPVLAA